MSYNSPSITTRADIFDSSGRLVCRCREPARRFVSRKPESEGKAFWKCAKFQDEPGNCRFWSWEHALGYPVTEDGYKAINAATQTDSDSPQHSRYLPSTPSPQKQARSGMESLSFSATQSNSGNSHNHTPSESSSFRTTPSITPTTPSNSRSRFMQSSSTPEAAAAAVARRKQLIQQQIAQTEADAAAATASTSQASGSRGPGRFTPKPTAQIFRQSVSGADSPSMDYEYENEVEMYGGDMRRSSPPPRPRTPESQTGRRYQEVHERVSINEEGSPRKRARGSDDGAHWTNIQQEDDPFRGQRAQPLFADHTQHRNPESSRASTAQVEEMLTRPTNGEPSASRQDNTTRPPLMTAPGAPKTPSSTGKTTETHIMNLQSLIEHLNLLERRRAAAEKQSEFRQNRITSLEQENKELDQENKELNLKLETTRLEVLEWRNKSDEKQDRITELTLEVRRLKGKGPAV